VAVLFLLSCLGLIPQIRHLTLSLAPVARANHWRGVWVWLDVTEALVFLATGWFLYSRSVMVIISASVAGSLMWVDAWFDVLTSFRRNIGTAFNLAVFVEIPLGFFCFYVALRTLKTLCFSESGHCRQDEDTTRDLEGWITGAGER
jgi:hypothetical protein